MLLSEPTTDQFHHLMERDQGVASDAQQRVEDKARQFADAIDPHMPRMLQAARRVLASDDLAWDAVQETLTRIWVRGWIPEEPGAALVHLTIKSSLHQLRCLRRRHHHEGRHAESGEVCCDEEFMNVEVKAASNAIAIRI